MGNINEMAGVGVPVEQAKALIGSKGTAAAAGSTQADAGGLGRCGVVTVSAANGTKGVVADSGLPVDSTQLVINAAASVLKIYPPSGGAINGLSADAAYSVGANQASFLIRVSSTAWAAVGEEA